MGKAIAGGRIQRMLRVGPALIHAACIRYPRTMARVLGELPMQSVRPVYSIVKDLEQKIPNKVYQTWLVDRVGKTHLRELAKFRALNSDYSFYFYDQEQMDEYMGSYFEGAPILDVYRRARYGPLKADIWRYCILWERGGAYFDINKLLGTSLSNIIEPTDTAVISFELNASPIRCPPSVAPQLQFPDRTVCNWGMMFEKGHPLLKLVIDGIVEKAPKYRGLEVSDIKSTIIALSGPRHLTECVYRYIASHGSDSIKQAGIDFFGTAIVNVRGAFVRYMTMPSYSLSSGGVILD